jgi:hypothetical protein
MPKMDSEKSSTESAIQSFLENIQEAIEKKLNPTGTFYNLTKAYDVLNHKILLVKLNSYGVRGVANIWFESYISHLRQYIEINHKIITNLKQGKCVSSMREWGMVCHKVQFLDQCCFFIYK